MVELRDQKIAKEQELRECNQEVQEITCKLNELVGMDDTWRNRIESALQRVSDLQEQSLLEGIDVDLSLILKQGQVEVEQAAAATDLSDISRQRRG